MVPAAGQGVLSHTAPEAIRPRGGQGVPQSHVGAGRDLWGS